MAVMEPRKLNAVLPIYYQIKQTIKAWIVNKEFHPGEKLPSVNELADKFDVNRLTVRQAISQLIQEGFLTSRRGEGTFVTTDRNLIHSFSFEFSGFMDDLIHDIPKLKTKSVEISRIATSRFIREKLELEDKDDEVVQIKRVRFLEDKFLTYTINYLPAKIGEKIAERDLYEKTLLQFLEEELRIQFTEAVQTIEASFANQEVAEKLEIASGSPILFVERTMYAKRHEPVELFQSVYRGDLHKFIVRFRNVKKKDGSKWVHRLD